ncbi:MAG: RDD family protein [Sulfurovum sp.]
MIEKKEIEFAIPSNNKRVTAFVIDDIIVSFLFIAIFYNQIMAVFSSFTVLDDNSMMAISSFVSQQVYVLFLIKIIYHTILVWQNGVTIGKHFMNIKVIDMKTGERPNLQTALLRAVIRIPSEALFYLGFLLAFFVPLKQTLHDKLSHCVVVDV